MKLHNTLTRNIDELSTLEPNKVKMYTCGLTVYSQPHIGNWVGYIYWDVLVRTLEHAGYNVERTQNYTDVGHLVSDDDSGEDKMEKGARREGVTAWDIANKYIAIADHEAYDLLGLKRPTHLIRATDYIEQQIAFAKELEGKGYTYVIHNEGVYFDTSKLSDYGKLAQLDISGLEAGARVSVDGKRNITDFAIWKFSPSDKKRDMEWDSPWGKGFPGWHLECSVIARETLGDQIDIHGGGVDHIPVHHTNEIAQTEAVTGKQFSQIWVHNNHLKVDGGKMAKSLGNVYTLQNIVDKGYSTEAFKLMVLSKHYRTEGNFTWEILEAAQNRLNSFYELAVLAHQVHGSETSVNPQLLADVSSEISANLLNDLNTPMALASIGRVVSLAKSGVGEDTANDFKAFLKLIDDLLGLKMSVTNDISSEQKELIALRETARNNRDWDESDRLRDSLEAKGIGVRDTPTGTLWYWL